MKRSVIHCQIEGVSLVGTGHEPDQGLEGSAKVGLLLLNAGPAPRAGNSDLYAHIADRLSQRGMPCFRFDFGGLGDSTGSSWQETRTYWRFAQQGGNDQAVLALVNELCSRYGLRGLVVGGLCAGAICAVRACDQPSERVLGMLLLEPNFRASHETGPRAAMRDGNVVDPKQTPRHKLSRLLQRKELVHILDSKCRSFRALAPLRPVARALVARQNGHPYPRDALVPVLQMWRRLLERRFPTLIVIAEGHIADKYLAQLARVLTLSPSKALSINRISNTNHIFTAGEARVDATRVLEHWLTEQFPGVMLDSDAAIRLHRPAAASPAASWPMSPATSP